MNRIKIVAILLSLPLLAHGAIIGEDSVAGSGIFSQTLFDPTAATSFMPSVQSLEQWSQSAEGRELVSNLDQESKGWVNLLQSANSKNEASILSPLLQELTPESAEKLKQNIKTLSATKNRGIAKNLVQEIVAQLNQAGEKAAPKVFSVLQNYASRFKSEENSSAISPKEFEEAKSLDQTLPTLASLYAQNEAEKESLRSISHSLAAVQYYHITQVLNPFWESGKNPDFNEPASKIITDPVFNLDTPRPIPSWMLSATPHSESHSINPSQFPHILIPTHADMIKIGGQSVRRTLFPNIPNGTGDNIPSILAQGNNASKSTQIMLYEETLDEDVDSILTGIKQGKSFEIIADYSNLFPHKLRRGGERSPQLQKLVDAYQAGNSNLKLYVLKGLGNIGIQHSKYRIWNIPLPNGQSSSILETGSYNYASHSQAHNWENVVLTEDLKLIAIYQQFFNWAKAIARPFSEDLEPLEPVISSPIPKDESLGQNFAGKSLPIATFSPDGRTGESWTQLIQSAQKDAFIGMFGFYPWPNLIATMIERLKAGLPIRILTDQKQSQNAASIADMSRAKEAGADIRIIGGASDDGLFHNKLVLAHSNNDGIVATGSTNMSFNGTQRNFENTLYLKDPYLGALTDFLEALWNIGTEPRADQLTPHPQHPEKTSPHR